MEKFTAGKWINRSAKGHYFSGAAAINTENESATIALVYGHPEEQQAANARLIAAAPEMYEAMKEFCDRVDRGEVRSKKTYSKFKEILAKVNQ